MIYIALVVMRFVCPAVLAFTSAIPIPYGEAKEKHSQREMRRP